MPVIEDQKQTHNLFYFGTVSLVTFNLAKLRNHFSKSGYSMFHIQLVKQHNYRISLTRNHISVDLFQVDTFIAKFKQSGANSKIQRLKSVIVIIDFAFSRVEQKKQVIEQFGLG